VQCWKTRGNDGKRQGYRERQIGGLKRDTVVEKEREKGERE
jgi:hypothetical protein